MNKQELIEEIEDLKDLKELFGNDPNYIEIDTVIRLISKLDEPQPIKLKDIITRMEGLSEHTRSEWLNDILYKFGSDYGTLKYKDGYEQGKFEASMIPYEEPQKVVVPQFVADVIEGAREKSPELEDALHYTWGNGTKEFTKWYNKKTNRDLFARAWLDGYEVEKEKRYLVKMKRINGYGRYLNKSLLSKEYFFASNNEICDYRTKFTRKELEQDGFGWVFDCEGIEIEEVE